MAIAELDPMPFLIPALVPPDDLDQAQWEAADLAGSPTYVTAIADVGLTDSTISDLAVTAVSASALAIPED
jgi:hypothetical protein